MFLHPNRVSETAAHILLHFAASVGKYFSISLLDKGLILSWLATGKAAAEAALDLGASFV